MCEPAKSVRIDLFSNRENLMSEIYVQKASQSQRSECMGAPGPNSPDRRAWIQKSTAALTVLLTGSRLLARGASVQEASLRSALDSMSSITGSPLENRWLEPTTSLVSAILADSKPLRALQLGSIEPATHFTADHPEND